MPPTTKTTKIPETPDKDFEELMKAIEEMKDKMKEIKEEMRKERHEERKYEMEKYYIQRIKEEVRKERKEELDKNIRRLLCFCNSLQLIGVIPKKNKCTLSDRSDLKCPWAERFGLSRGVTNSFLEILGE